MKRYVVSWKELNKNLSEIKKSFGKQGDVDFDVMDGIQEHLRFIFLGYPEEDFDGEMKKVYATIRYTHNMKRDEMDKKVSEVYAKVKTELEARGYEIYGTPNNWNVVAYKNA